MRPALASIKITVMGATARFAPLIAALWVLAPAHQAAAEDVFTVTIKKQETKEKHRWSIEQWFATRDKMRLQDLWFAIHAPSPYEFFVSGDYRFGRTRDSATDDANAWRVSAAAYASIFGLEFQNEFRLSQWHALLKFRPFGFHVQATNITVEVGLRSQTNPTIFRNVAAGVSATIYLHRYFGIEGLWRHYFDSADNVGNIRTTGDLYELFVFIDYSLVRVYGGYSAQFEQVRQGSVGVDNNLQGPVVGLKIFF